MVTGGCVHFVMPYECNRYSDAWREYRYCRGQQRPLGNYCIHVAMFVVHNCKILNTYTNKKISSAVNNISFGS